MGKYLPTALGNLDLAWKLLAYAHDEKIDLDKLNQVSVWEENGTPFYISTNKFETYDDLLIAFENNCLIAFGVAAITLNTAREEIGLKLPNPINSEFDQFMSITYQIRNAFAHDMPEPRWNLKDTRYIRKYEFGKICIDISEKKHDDPLCYKELGGPDTLHRMADYFHSQTDK